MLYKSNGNFYKGSFINGLPHGSGEMVLPEGDIYNGDFKKGMKHGEGKLIMKGDGCGVFIGEF